MPGRDPSERERLLKLIDRTPRQGPVPEVASAATTVPKVKPGPRAASTVIGGESVGRWKHIAPAVVVRRTAAAVLVAVLIYGAADILINLLGAAEVSISPKATVSSTQAHAAAPAPLKDIGAYLTPVGQKNVFDPSRLTSAQQQPAADPNAPLNASGLKLVGVDWGDEPVALIEDTVGGRTYFVKSGDSIKNIKIQEVQRNRVLIDTDGTVTELKA